MNNTEINILEKALKQENYLVRREALENLNCSIRDTKKTIKEDRSYEKVIPILTAALTDPDGYVAVLAAEALVSIDRNYTKVGAFTIVKTLIEIMATKRDELVDEEEDDINFCDLTVGESAAYILSDIAGSVSSTAPEIIQLFSNSDPQYRRAVNCALSSMIYANPAAFTQALTDPNKLVRLGVLDLLLALEEDRELYDEEIKLLIPALEKVLQDENKQVRKAASKLFKSLKMYDY